MLHSLILLASLFLSGCVTSSSISEGNLMREWLPALAVPTSATTVELAGEGRDVEYTWVDARDIDDDGRVDAIVTIQRSEAAGGRNRLVTRQSVVMRGTGSVGATFSMDRSVTWFRIQTFYGLYRAVYPDNEVRRQFSLTKNGDDWSIHICENSYQNSAGDSQTRGMRPVARKLTTLPVADLELWSPLLSED